MYVLHQVVPQRAVRSSFVTSLDVRSLFLPQLLLISQFRRLKSPNNAARINVSLNAFFGSRSENYIFFEVAIVVMLTTVMTRIVVDKSIDNATPHPICRIG